MEEQVRTTALVLEFIFDRLYSYIYLLTHFHVLITFVHPFIHSLPSIYLARVF